eukprot:3304421-Pyramimonas_sp.AAC.1
MEYTSACVSTSNPAGKVMNVSSSSSLSVSGGRRHSRHRARGPSGPRRSRRCLLLALSGRQLVLRPVVGQHRVKEVLEIRELGAARGHARSREREDDVIDGLDPPWERSLPFLSE